MRLRWAGAGDHDALGQVMFDAVRHGQSLYTEAQRRAWVPAAPDGADWSARLAAQAVALVERGDEILGFMSLAEGGYIDLAFIRPAAQGMGLFRRLYAAIEARARAEALVRLHTHASLMAQPAFAAVGFSVVAGETVAVRGEAFARFIIEKPLAISPG